MWAANQKTRPSQLSTTLVVELLQFICAVLVGVTRASVETGNVNRSTLTGALLIVCSLAVIAYLPAQGLPFIADDYVQIKLGRDYGPMHSWLALLRDPLYRCRSTSVVLTYWTERVAGLTPLAFNFSSLLLHVVNCALVLALGAWRAVGWKLAFATAAFFAIAEGHQEAVIWYAAVPELLVFLFSAVSFLAFVLSITRSGSRKKLWYATAFISFVFALASKESGVALVGALLLACIVERIPFRRSIALLLPFGALACVYMYAILMSSSDILHFQDGAFSFSAPFPKTLFNSSIRMLWFWGIAAIVVLVVWNSAAAKTLLSASLCWIVVSLFPYSFLTYMNRVPSRHTYLASVGLSILVGVAVLSVAGRKRSWIIALVTLIIAHNCTYLWTRKRAQYERRAEATEQLLQACRRNSSKIRIDCFPYSRWIAQYTVEIGAKRDWDESMWQVRSTCGPEETTIIVED